MKKREGGKDDRVCGKNEESTEESKSSLEEDVERNEEVYRQK